MAAKSGRHSWWALAAISLLVVLAVAWIDGGEREIGLIVEEIPPPEETR